MRVLKDNTKASAGQRSTAPAAAADQQYTAPAVRTFRFGYTQERAMTLVAVVLIIVFSLTSSFFFTTSNLLGMASSAAYFAIVGVSMTVLFIVGEFDLSLGAVYGLTCTIIAYVNITYYGPWLSALIGVAAALLVGLLNGFFTTRGKVPSFIVTVGMLSVLEGVTQYISGGQPMTLDPDAQHSTLATITNWAPLSIPASVLLAGAIMLGTAFLLRSTRLGAHIYLVGGNQKAARQVGINVVRVKMFCFLFAAFLAALAGVLQTFQLGSAQPGTGQGNFLFQAVGAAIIGGVALNGGAGSIYGTFVGATILAVLNNGLVLSGIDPGLGVAVTGALIVVAGLLQAGIRQMLAALFTRTRIRRAKGSPTAI